jgi:ParB/RepB/Spo0J family partition protein
VSGQELASVSVADLVHLRRNPQFMSAKEMEALREGIRRDGFLAPVLVRPMDDGRYEIVSGNHRVLAAKEAGLTHVPAIVKPMDDRQAQRIAVNLNTVHGDPTPELLAPFLAELDDATLADVHLDRELEKGLREFDADLALKLASLDVPEAFDHASPKGRVPTSCRCPTCGHQHAPKR